MFLTTRNPSLVLTLCLIATCSGTVCMMSSQSLVPAAAKEAASANRSDLRFSVARAKEAENDLLAALDSYQQLYQENPNRPEIAHRLGVTLVRTGNVDQGLTYLLEADASMTRNHEVKGDIGYAYILLGQFELAEDFLRDALNVNPSDQRSINNLALAVGTQGRVEEAFNLYKRVMTEPEANSNIAYIHAQRGETDLALARYNSALSANPKLTSAAEGLVQVLELQRQIAQHDRTAPQDSSIQLATHEIEVTDDSDR